MTAPPIHCIECGYPLDGAASQGACPECGTPGIRSFARWEVLGGEGAAVGRLLLASTSIATFSLLLFLLSLARFGNFRAFGGVEPWERAAGELSMPAASACAIGAWWIWFVAVRTPALRPFGRMSPWTTPALFAWLLLLIATSAIHLLHLDGPGSMSRNEVLHPVIRLVRHLTYTPIPIAISILVHAAPPVMRAWRRRSRASRAIAWLLVVASLAVFASHAILMAMMARMEPATLRTSRLFDWFLDAGGVLWSGAIPLLLLALAIAQLAGTRRAWRDAGPAFDRSHARRAVTRRALIGALVLPAAVGFAFLFSWMTRSSLDELPTAITSALRDRDAQTTPLDWILVWLVALGSLWLACALLPLAVMRRRVAPDHAA